MFRAGLAVNFLLIESLQRFYQYYGDEVQVECPTGSGDYMNLANVAEEIQHRIIHIFGRDREGRRATNGGHVKLDHDPHFRDYVWFYEVRHDEYTPKRRMSDRATLSFSMLIMDEVLERRTRLAGLVWSHITFCRVVPIVVCLRHRKVRTMLSICIYNLLTALLFSSTECCAPLL